MQCEGPREQLVRARGFLNLCLVREDLAEFEYRPTNASRSYRVVVLRKTIVEERDQMCLGQDYRYSFYITNDRTMTPEQVDLIRTSFDAMWPMRSVSLKPPARQMSGMRKVAARRSHNSRNSKRV